MTTRERREKQIETGKKVIEAVRELKTNNPDISCVEIGKELGIPESMARRIVKEVLA